MRPSRDRLAMLVEFDHWSWLFFIVWFAAATVLVIAGPVAGRQLVYWGIILVLLNNFARLFLLTDHFRLARKLGYWLASLLLVLLLLGSMVFQLVIRR